MLAPYIREMHSVGRYIDKKKLKTLQYTNDLLAKLKESTQLPQITLLDLFQFFFIIMFCKQNIL